MPAAYVRWNWRAGIVSRRAAPLLLLVPVCAAGARSWSCSTTNARAARRASSASSCRGAPGKTKQERKPGVGRSRARSTSAARARGLASRATWWGARRACGWLPARHGTWRCTGCCRTRPRQDVIGNYLEERKVRVTRGQTQRGRVRLPAQGGADRGAAPPRGGRGAGAGARRGARRARLAALREGRQRRRCSSAPGKHTLLVGVADRVFERVVEVRELVGQSSACRSDARGRRARSAAVRRRSSPTSRGIC